MKSILIGLLLPFVLLSRPLDIRSPNLEPSRGAKPRPPVDVPIGCDRLLSASCKVSSSDTNLTPKALLLVTDGNKEYSDISTVKLAPGIQWVQLEFGFAQKIHAIYIWRYLSEPHVFRDMIVQLSNDAGFQEDVETVFNNDDDNTVGLGVGRDKEYIETFMGRSIPVNGIKARYVRIYSNGSVMDRGKTDKANYYTEIEVYGEPYVMLEMTMPRSTFTSDTTKLDKTNLEPSRNGKPRPSIFIPVNATNVLSLKCEVASSDSSLQKEKLCLIVDGNKEIDETKITALDPTIDKQWVQLDLGQEKEIFALCIWHDYTHPYVYQNVVVQLSSDPDFLTGVTTVFNNDWADKLGFGKGRDKEYIETYDGRPVAVDGVKSRYIRLYGRCRLYPQIHYKEIEVYGRDPIPAENIRIRVSLPKPRFF